MVKIVLIMYKVAKKFQEGIYNLNGRIVSGILSAYGFLETNSNKLLQIYLCITLVLIAELFTDTIWLSCAMGFSVGLYKEYLDEKYGSGKDIRDVTMYAIGVIIAAIYLNLLKEF